MLQLTFHSGSSAAISAALTVSELEVTGGTLSCDLDYGPIATYRHDSWEYNGLEYSTLGLSGRSRLLLAITRELTTVSDPLEHFYFMGPALSANGVAVAKYIERQDIWRGIVRLLWWRAMRIVAADRVAALVDDSQLILLNPWETEPSQGGVPDRAASDHGRCGSPSGEGY